MDNNTNSNANNANSSKETPKSNASELKTYSNGTSENKIISGCIKDGKKSSSVIQTAAASETGGIVDSKIESLTTVFKYSNILLNRYSNFILEKKT